MNGGIRINFYVGPGIQREQSASDSLRLLLFSWEPLRLYPRYPSTENMLQKIGAISRGSLTALKESA